MSLNASPVPQPRSPSHTTGSFQQTLFVLSPTGRGMLAFLH